MVNTKKRRSTAKKQIPIDPTFQNVFTLYPIFESICGYLSPRDIVTLQKTTKQLSSSFETLFKTQWNINRLLKRFVVNPTAFRSAMAEVNAIISGSFALQFFERVEWTDSDLDVYVHDVNDMYGQALGKYLQSVEGYSQEPENPIITAYHQLRGLRKVDTYTRKIEKSDQVSKIQIISTSDSPVCTILKGFYTTAVVNFITHDAAYSIFPDATFSHRTYMLQPLAEFFGPRLQKYSRRGWDTLETLWDEDKNRTRSFDLEGYRRIGDSLTWKIPLDTMNVKRPKIPFMIEYNHFTMRYVRFCDEDHDTRFYDISAFDFESPVLRYPYTYSKEALPKDDFWCGFVGNRLTPLIYMELLKIKVEDRPFDIDAQWYFHYANRIRENKPNGWRFWDDEIPRWFEAFKQKRLEEKKAEEDVDAMEE